MAFRSPRPCRCSFAARWLAASCLLAAATLTGCGSPVTKEHTAAIAKIQDLGGSVNFKRGGYEVLLMGTATTNEDLPALKDISNLKSLDLRGTTVTDEGLVHLKSLTSLEFLNVERTGVTHDAAEELRKALPNADIRR